ncbi:hypothetical protein DM02DRAFT_610519 [Periconia macrospinosa]|uniref:Uncharacterized protein n=1 Tax=Periconia macrospinosa TaxID=97972 RepID=A0A2V1E4M5_9PLEO|nr:hypothetical protein DM02DRAFT_610519 [Periconia macrospinosa]
MPALSKAAAEHRRNNQIPRKRPQGSSQSYRQVPRVRKAPPKKDQKKRAVSNVLPQPLRGENRKVVPGNTGDSWPVRRIIASRQRPGDPSVLEYKVQWETSWEEASTIVGPAVAYWKEAQRADETFVYRAKGGAKWTVLKDEAKDENDHEDMQWDMWVAIHRNVLAEIEKDWLDGLADDDFEFAESNGRVALAPGREGLSALATLRTAWKDSRAHPHLLDHEILYGDVKIRYIGQLDPRCEEAIRNPIHRHALPICTIVRALQSHNLSDLDVNTFCRSKDAHTSCKYWCDILYKLIASAPFIFRSGTWIQLLALLLLSGDDFRNHLEGVGVKVDEEWPSRAREYAMHMYYETIMDDRAPHDIQETFFCLREFFRNLTPDEDEQPNEEVESPAGSVYGTDGVRLPPLEDVTSTLAELSDQGYDSAAQKSSSYSDSSSVVSSTLVPKAQLPPPPRRTPFTKPSPIGSAPPSGLEHMPMQQEHVEALFGQFVQWFQGGAAHKDFTMPPTSVPQVSAQRMSASASVSNRRGSFRQVLPSFAELNSRRMEDL